MLAGLVARVMLATWLAAGVALGAQAEDDPSAEAAWEAFNRDGVLAAAEADWPAAEAAFRAALEVLAADDDGTLPALDRVDDDDARVATVAGNLAVVLLQQEELDEARQLLEQALGIRRAVFGTRDPAIAESLNNLAELERRTGEFDRARTLHEAALGLRREVFDDGHPDIAESLNNLGVLLRDLGELEAAAALLGEAHGIRRERLGAGHAATLESTGNLAAVALDLGDRVTAEAVLLAAVEALPADAATAGGMPAYLLRQTVDVLLLQDEVDAAVLLCEERVLGGREEPGEVAADAAAVPDLVSAELLAACARALGRVGGEARAARLLEQRLEQVAASAADVMPAVEAELRWGLAETAARAGDLEAAERELGQVVALLETSGDQRLATALNNLGSIRFERGRPLEASADLETALDLLDDPAVAVDPGLRRDVLANYAIVLRTLDRNTEALAVENRLIDLSTNPERIEPAAGD